MRLLIEAERAMASTLAPVNPLPENSFKAAARIRSWVRSGSRLRDFPRLFEGVATIFIKVFVSRDTDGLSNQKVTYVSTDAAVFQMSNWSWKPVGRTFPPRMVLGD